MVRPGDEVYFSVGGKPATGKVLCHGKHGCQVKDNFGQVRKLKYQHILGHKTRVDTSLRVVDQGADGAILEDETGRRSYTHGYQPPEPAPAPAVPRDAWNDLAGNARMAKAVMEPALDFVRETLQGQLMAKAEPMPMPVPELDTGPLLVAVAAMVQQLQADFSARLEALAVQVAAVSGQMAGGDATRQALVEALEEARKPLPPIELTMHMSLPDKKPMAMRGVRGPDGSITMVPIESPA